MQDLEIIERKNAEASAREIPSLRSAGKFVVALYSGLNYCSHEAFGSAAEAQAYVEQRIALNEPGERTQLLEPIEPVSHELAKAAAPAVAKTAPKTKTHD